MVGIYVKLQQKRTTLCVPQREGCELIRQKVNKDISGTPVLYGSQHRNQNGRRFKYQKFNTQ